MCLDTIDGIKTNYFKMSYNDIAEYFKESFRELLCEVQTQICK